MVGAIIGGVASIAGSVISSSATSDAAKTQANASNAAAQLQQDRYNTTRSDLQPYNDQGQNALSTIGNNLGNYSSDGSAFTSKMTDSIPSSTLNGIESYIPSLRDNSTVPGGMSQAELEATPGYQFTRDQGLAGVQSSASARGLGVSGAALKGAASYATGLADNTYQNQFNIKQTQFSDQYNKDQANASQSQNIYSDRANLASAKFNQNQNTFTDWQNVGTFDQNAKTNALNRLSSVAGLGESAAAQSGTLGAQAATASGNYLTAGANAVAASQIAGANAISSGINKAANSYLQSNSVNSLTGGSGTYGSSGSAYDNSYYGYGQNNSASNNYLAGAYNDTTGTYSNVGGGAANVLTSW